jgi:pimeloyl-[acyl-carrier protein] methyl ester esterase
MAELYTETSGTGQAVVIWHGWGMNLRVFDALRAALSPYFQVIVVDLPGHGRSDWPGPMDGDQQLALLMRTVPRGAALIGWSLGGQFALRAAALGATQARALVLLNSTPRFLRNDDWPHGLDSATLQRFATQSQQNHQQLLTDFLDLQTRGSAHSAESLRALQAALIGHGTARPEALDAGLQLLADSDLRAVAAQVDIPTLVVGGQHDRVTPPGAARALAQLLPVAHHLELPRAGHTPFLSHNAQLVPVLREFLAAA